MDPFSSVEEKGFLIGDNMRVIVRVGKDPEEYSDTVQEMGGRVVRVLRLVPALVVEAPDDVVEILRNEPWVVSVEPDREVGIEDE